MTRYLSNLALIPLALLAAGCAGSSGLPATAIAEPEIAAAYFREQLAGPAGARARQQLTDRDVNAQAIEALGLGFAPPSRTGLLGRVHGTSGAMDLPLVKC